MLTSSPLRLFTPPFPKVKCMLLGLRCMMSNLLELRALGPSLYIDGDGSLIGSFGDSTKVKMIHEKGNLGEVLIYVTDVVPFVDLKGLKTEDLSMVFESFGWLCLYLSGRGLGLYELIFYSCWSSSSLVYGVDKSGAFKYFYCEGPAMSSFGLESIFEWNTLYMPLDSRVRHVLPIVKRLWQIGNEG